MQFERYQKPEILEEAQVEPGMVIKRRGNDISYAFVCGKVENPEYRGFLVRELPFKGLTFQRLSAWSFIDDYTVVGRVAGYEAFGHTSSSLDTEILDALAPPEYDIPSEHDLALWAI